MKLTYNDLYKRYNNVLKPLISEQEGRLETFAEPLLHSLSSMLDSVALADSYQGNEHDLRLNSANEALDLSISLSYQYLIFALKSEMEKFEDRVSKDAREKLGGGRFIGQYTELRRKSLSIIEKCKNKNNDLESLPLYKEAYENMTELERLINEYNTEVIIAENEKRSWYCKIILKFLGIVISVGVGYFVGNMLISFGK
jgi:hypothetical protein